MSQDITIEHNGVITNLGPVESVRVGDAGYVLVHAANGAVVSLPFWAIDGIDHLARCGACHRIAPLVLGECPDCRH